MLKYALLGFLLHQPMSGYDLERAIRTSIQHIWSAQLSQIYRTLKQLEDDGLVTSAVEPQEGRPDRRVYTLTDTGRAEFGRWIAPTVTEVDAVRSPSMLRMFFSAARPVEDTLAQLRLMRELYVRERDQLAGEVAQQIQSLVDAFGPDTLDPLFWDVVRRAGEMHAQTWIDWTEEATVRLEQIRAARAAGAQEPPTPS